jgi:hypothetical protein
LSPPSSTWSGRARSPTQPYGKCRAAAVTVSQMPIIEKPWSQYDIEVDKLAFDFAARNADQRVALQPADAANAESLRPGDHLGQAHNLYKTAG